MRPLTEHIPKALIEIENRPFVDHQLRLLSSFGVDEVVFCIGYRGDRIRQFVGEGKRWGLSVRFVDEGTDLRGTAGALRLALEAGVLSESFFVTYGDSYLPIDLGEVWGHFQATQPEALMTVFRNQGRWDTSNVSFAEGRVLLYDKHACGEEKARMEFIDYGISALRRETVRTEIPPGERADLSALFHRLSRGDRLAGYEVKNRFYEIGSPEGLEDFREYILRNCPPSTAQDALSFDSQIL
jgi:NDP-sugar pyrophosphorylase family protein